MPDNILDIIPKEVPPVETEQPVADPLYEEMFTYTKAKPRIDNLISSFDTEKGNIKRLRKERYVDVDVEELRNNGEIEEDETFIPDRVIDNNITRDIPDAVNFLVGSHRLAIFRCLSNPDVKTRRLELEFTKGLTYSGWYRPFFRSFDGAALHGWDAVEVVFDATKPLHVGFEHVGTDKIYFSKDASDIQESEYCIREYSVSLFRLESYVKNYGFDPVQVKLISDANRDSKRDKKLCIFKVYFKYNNCVYVTWYAKEGNVSDWLKAPDKLKMGIKEMGMVQGPPVIMANPLTGLPEEMPPQMVEGYVDKEIDQYPIFLYIYKDDENEVIVDHKGRGFMDSPTQEATTAIITGFVNTVTRSSNVYCSVKGMTDSSDVIQLDTKLQHGHIYSNELNFFSTPPPDVMVLQSLQMLSQKNSNDTGKIASSVMNRKDARKTAEELQQAAGEENKITGASLTTLSEFLREVFTFSFQIVQSQAEQDLIDFLLVSQPSMTGEINYTNDFNTITQVYDIRPAGDDDIVKAEADIQKMQQDWPVIQTTPLKDVFLQDLVALRYPEKADKYVPILQAADPRQLILSLSTLLQAFTSPQDLASLAPEQLTQLQQVQQQVIQYLGVTQQNEPQSNISGSGGQNPKASAGTGSGQGASQPATPPMAKVGAN